MQSIVTRSLTRKAALVAVSLAVTTLSASADDIDVYTEGLEKRKKPNVLFVLDYSGSMRKDVNGDDASDSGLPRKIDILREAVNDVLEANTGRINAGIGSIYASQPSGVRWPIRDLEADAHETDAAIPKGEFSVKDLLVKQLDRRDAGGATTTVNALAEAARYFKGMPVTHNDADVNRPWHHRPDRWDVNLERYNGGNTLAAIPWSYLPSDAYQRDVPFSGQTGTCVDNSSTGGEDGCQWKRVIACAEHPIDDSDSSEGTYRSCEYEHPDRWDGASYDSPINSECQANAIVLISDGVPTVRLDNQSLTDVLNTSPDACENLSDSIFANTDDTSTQGNCAIEIVRELANNDQNPSIPDSKVKTYTVGFSVADDGQNYLKRLAEEGDGSFLEANNAASLLSALKTQLDELVDASENFSEPTVDIDKGTFSHDNRAYFNLFKPSLRSRWSGNLKGYFLDSNGLLDIHGNSATIEADDGTRFAEDSQSFWSLTADGNTVMAGGANERLIPSERKLYTYVGETIPSQGVPLASSAAHRLDSSNSALTAEHLDMEDYSGLRDDVLDWMREAPLGDALHSKPVRVDYGDRKVVFNMTNQGFLHAFDATYPVSPGASDTRGGEELFAFMPRRLLKNIPTMALDRDISGHIYGLDGGLTRWHEDSNNDGVVNGSEKVLLVFGMRRGGTAYYALDVTSPEAPRLMWTIDNETSGFERLAQSWSRPSLVKVKRGTGTDRILAFGGGYDAEKLDDKSKRDKSLGNALYFIDRNGKLVWSASSEDAMKTVGDMEYAIASDLTLIDSDADGLADRLYTGDVGGQLWRVDFDDVSQSSDFTVTRLADFGLDDSQPFFYAPSVALNRNGSEDYLSISIGSGDRTDPLARDSSNALFVLRDEDVAKGAPDSGHTLVHMKDLHDATSNAIVSGDEATAAAAESSLLAARGWMLKLKRGEKALSRLVTFEGKLLATTFQEDLSPDNDPCSSAVFGRFYLLDIKDARTLKLNDDGTIAETPYDGVRHSARLKTQGIPSSAQTLFAKDSGKVLIVVDKQTVSVLNQSLTSVFWHAR